MKSLKHYIVESLHTYDITVKVAGEVDKNFLDMFMYNLKKFEPVEMGPPKTLPVMKSPYGFPNLSNQPVTIIKCKFRYPATEPMIQQMAQLLGYNINMVRVVDTKYDEFTSVIDRTVAQIGSSAIAKTVRKRKQKFVAVSCHYDIEEWLRLS